MADILNHLEGKLMNRRRFLSLTATGALAFMSFPGFNIRKAFGAAPPIIIGHPDPVTGVYAAVGQFGIWGATIAVDRINRDGGVNGRPLKLIIEDTAANPTQAIRKTEKLILQDKVDVIQGYTSSSVCLACMPTAVKHKIIYMIGICLSADITGKNCNKFTFRPFGNSKIQGIAIAKWLVKNVGKRWFFSYADYSWGQNTFRDVSGEIIKAGGELVGSLNIPLSTKDMMPYLTKIPRDVDGLYLIHAGADGITVTKQVYELGLRKKMRIAADGAVIPASNLPAIGEAASEGIVAIDRYIPVLEGPLDTPYNKAFHKAFAKISGGKSPDRFVQSNYEGINFLKKAMEETNFQSRKDTMKLVDALEGMAVKEGYDFPQGDKFIRKEDHQAFLQQFIFEIKAGKQEILDVVPKEKMIYPPTTCDLTKG